PQPPPTTTAPPTTAPTPQPRSRPPALIASGVRIGKVPVGGLTRAAAERAVQGWFARPLVFLVGRERLAVPAARLGAVPYPGPAVARALAPKPGAIVPLPIALHGAPRRARIRLLAKGFDRKPVHATVPRRNLRPVLS